MILKPDNQPIYSLSRNKGHKLNLRIADIFTASLAKLTDDEKKVVKTTAFDLQMNPASPGMKYHKLGQAWDKHFGVVRVGSETFIKHPSVRNVAMAIDCLADEVATAVRSKTIKKSYKTINYKL